MQRAVHDHTDVFPGLLPLRTPTNPSPKAPSSCPYPPSHTSFSSPISPVLPPASSAPLLSSHQALPQPCPRKIDYNRIFSPTSPVSIYTDLHFSVFLSHQAPFAPDGTSSHMVCVYGQLAVNVCRVGRRGWRADVIERGGSYAGHWPEGRLEEYGRERGPKTVG